MSERKRTSGKVTAAKVAALVVLMSLAVWTKDSSLYNQHGPYAINNVATIHQNGASWREMYERISAVVSDAVGTMLSVLPTGQSNKNIFTSLPGHFESEKLKPTEFIKLIVINYNPGERVTCRNGLKGYEFFVLFADDTSTLESACGTGKDKYDYASEILAYLNYSRGLPSFTKEELGALRVVAGDGELTLKNLSGI